MTDTDSKAGAPASDTGASAPPEAGVRIMAQFIRDLSFENPRAPDSLRAGMSQPQIDLGVEMNARSRKDGLFEVDLKLSATAQRDDETVFQVELVYGGLFQVTGVTDADLELVLMVECPRYLFPFARRMISDLTSEGGFPPLRLEPIDFAQIYLARKAQSEGAVAGTA
jgi:preprotein translocase subunit SecB